MDSRSIILSIIISDYMEYVHHPNDYVVLFHCVEFLHAVDMRKYCGLLQMYLDQVLSPQAMFIWKKSSNLLCMDMCK